MVQRYATIRFGKTTHRLRYAISLENSYGLCVDLNFAGTTIYTYPASGAGSVRPHAVTSINGTIGNNVNPNYTYDANGNMITAFAGTRVITYESFNMPRSISRSGISIG